MNIILDTNVIIGIVRANDYSGIISFLNPENSSIYISIVSEAEVRSFAVRRKWGPVRLELLNRFLSDVNIMEVNNSSVNIYVEIDTYSQCVNPNFVNYPFATPRNMGKNDLWIASLSAFLGLRLVTTDSDFDHLHNVFFEVQKIRPDDFLPFF